MAQNVVAQPIVIATISFGTSRSGAIAANPTTNRVYAAQEDVPAIAVIDGATNTVMTTIPTLGYHTGIDVNPVTNRIYVAQQFAGSVRIIDGATNAVITDLPVPGSPIGDLAVNPATNRLYVIRINSNDVAVFDAATNTLLTTVPVGAGPLSIAANSATNRIYVANGSGASVTVIDGGSNTVVTTIAVGNSPHGVGVNSTTNRLYVSNYNDNTISVIDGATNTVIATVPVGSGPVGVGINPVANRIYVANPGGNSVFVIDGATNTVVDTVPVPSPMRVAVIPNTSRVYVEADHGVSVIEDLPATSLVASRCDSTEIYPGDPICMNLDIQYANNLYAAQTTCAVNPAILQPQSGVFGDSFFDPINRLIDANVVSPTAGTWFGAISQRSPALPLSGNGLFAAVTYTALNPGVTAITCDPLLSDRDGFTQTVSFSETNVTVLPFATISSTARYQGRLDHAGIAVTATGLVTRTTSTDLAGDFVLDQLKAGSYNVVADAARYLPSCITPTVTSGQVLTLTTTILRGGDANDDGAINIGDATLVAANFGLYVPPADPRADVNANGVVNIQDLAILGGNYGLAGCQSW